LEDWSGRPVRGLAYPFGTYDSRIPALLPKLGMEYARTAAATGTFALPEQWLEWRGTCHHARALELGEQFLELPDGEPALMYVWGHSYELDGFMTADVYSASVETAIYMTKNSQQFQYLSCKIGIIVYAVAQYIQELGVHGCLLPPAARTRWGLVCDDDRSRRLP
jgi:hypothetical protein